MYTCQYCNKELSSRPNLKVHQAKTQYCLELQRKITLETEPLVAVITLPCSVCGKIFLEAAVLKRHLYKCTQKSSDSRDISRLSDLVDTLQQTITNMKVDHAVEVSSLKGTIEIMRVEQVHEREKTHIYNNLFTTQQQLNNIQSNKLLERSGNTITHINAKNVNMGTLNLTRDRLDPLRDTFTLDHYNRGGIGSADWVVDNILTDSSGALVYRCTDKNRKQFVYRDESGSTVTDVNATRLKAVIAPLMRDKIREYRRIKCLELGDLSDDDNSITRNYDRLYREHTDLDGSFERRLVQKTYS